MITLQDVKDYLGIEFDDPGVNRRLEHLIKVSKGYLIGALGEDYPTEDDRVKELAYIVISDLYDNHDLNDKVSGNVRRLVNDFSLQIKLEMRRKASTNGI